MIEPCGEGEMMDAKTKEIVDGVRHAGDMLSCGNLIGCAKDCWKAAKLLDSLAAQLAERDATIRSLTEWRNPANMPHGGEFLAFMVRTDNPETIFHAILEWSEIWEDFEIEWAPDYSDFLGYLDAEVFVVGWLPIPGGSDV